MKVSPQAASMIRVPLAKGAYLLLSWPEYEKALHRGKMERRRLNYEKRELRLAERGDR